MPYGEIIMRLRFQDRDGFVEAGERARALHSAWLTKALTQGLNYPRIPIRPMNDDSGEGGFDRMMTRNRGQARAEQWWKLALERVDDPPRSSVSGMEFLERSNDDFHE